MSIPNRPIERRHFFRVNRDLLFDYKPVDIHALETKSAAEALGVQAESELAAQLQRIDRESEASLRSIASRDRALAEYLSRLSEKIDLVARHSVFRSSSTTTKEVSLGEGGLAFDCERALYRGNYLAVRLLFLPSYAQVMNYARIIRCDSSGETFRAAIEFHQLNDKDRQTLAREVLRAQAGQRKHPALSENNHDDNNN